MQSLKITWTASFWLQIQDSASFKKDSATRFSTSGFFHESVSSKPLIRPDSNIFEKSAEIFAAQGAPTLSLTLVANGKNFNQKINIFFWTPLGSRVNIKIHFSSSSL
jgi:hypothetical protein